MKHSKKNNERGIALLFVLFALVLLTGIATGLLFLTNTETNINSNYGAAQISYFAARSGAEEVKSRMQVTAANTLDPLLPITMPGTPNGVLYVINQTPGDVAVTPWTVGSAYADDQFCQDWGGPGMPVIGGLQQKPLGQRCDTLPNGVWYRNPAPASTGPGFGTAAALPYKWTRVTLKANASVDGAVVDGTAQPSLTAGNQICWNGGNEVLLTAPALTCQTMAPAMTPVYMLTTLAVSPTGARRMTQIEVAKNLMPPIPSALTLNGDNARTTFGTPHSNNFGISGDDACSGQLLPAIGTVTDGDDAGVAAKLFRPDMYTGEGATPSVVNLNNPPSIPPRLQDLRTVADMKKLVANITTNADAIVNMPAVVPNLGTPGNPATSKITVINGDFGGPCDGNGVLLITGNATCSGSTKFDGLMLIIGKGNIQFNGGGNGQINGALFIANLFDNNNQPLPDMSVPGLPTFDWNGGGTNFIQYDSCKILNSFNKATYRMLAMREVTY